jgi:hypothetical protein
VSDFFKKKQKKKKKKKKTNATAGIGARHAASRRHSSDEGDVSDSAQRSGKKQNLLQFRSHRGCLLLLKSSYLFVFQKNKKKPTLNDPSKWSQHFPTFLARALVKLPANRATAVCCVVLSLLSTKTETGNRKLRGAGRAAGAPVAEERRLCRPDSRTCTIERHRAFCCLVVVVLFLCFFVKSERRVSTMFCCSAAVQVRRVKGLPPITDSDDEDDDDVTANQQLQTNNRTSQ